LKVPRDGNPTPSTLWRNPKVRWSPEVRPDSSRPPPRTPPGQSWFVQRRPRRRRRGTGRTCSNPHRTVHNRLRESVRPSVQEPEHPLVCASRCPRSRIQALRRRRFGEQQRGPRRNASASRARPAPEFEIGRTARGCWHFGALTRRRGRSFGCDLACGLHAAPLAASAVPDAAQIRTRRQLTSWSRPDGRAGGGTGKGPTPPGPVAGRGCLPLFGCLSWTFESRNSFGSGHAGSGQRSRNARVPASWEGNQACAALRASSRSAEASPIRRERETRHDLDGCMVPRHRSTRRGRLPGRASEILERYGSPRKHRASR